MADAILKIFDNHHDRQGTLFRVQEPWSVHNWCYHAGITDATISDFNSETGFVSFKSDNNAILFKLGFEGAEVISKKEFYTDLLEVLPEEIDNEQSFVDGYRKQEATKHLPKDPNKLHVRYIMDKEDIKDTLETISKLEALGDWLAEHM